MNDVTYTYLANRARAVSYKAHAGQYRRDGLPVILPTLVRLFLMKTETFNPAKARAENENALLDRDGFPPCVMTVEEFCAHVRETFGYPSFRIVAFRVRGYADNMTLTSRRGEMPGKRVTKAQAEAYRRATNGR